MFQPITVSWKAESYTIPPDGVLRAIAAIEDVITLGELARDSETGTIRFTRIAKAWGALLRHLGSKVSDDDVYAELFSGNLVEVKERISLSVSTLIAMMVVIVPPQAEAAAINEGKPRQPGPVARLKRSTKR